MTHCGDSGFSPSGMSSYDWSKFECTYPGSYFDISYTYGKEICSSGGRVCFKREQYTDSPGFGCPGIDLCCANYCETVQQEETKVEYQDSSSDTSASNELVGSAFIAIFIAFVLFIVLFALLPPMRNWSVQGRLRRAPYWVYRIVSGLVLGCVYVPATVLDMGTVSVLTLVFFSLMILIPDICITARRLHDADHSGWNYLWSFIPCAGPLVLLAFGLEQGSEGQNTYGFPERKWV